MHRLFLLLVALATAPAVAAQPDFSTSKAEATPVPAIAGDVLRYDVSLTNSGAAASYARVTVTLPQGFFIGTGGDCARAAYDPERPGFVWHEGPFTAGITKRCIVDVLTRRDAAGTRAPLAVEINAPPGFYHRLDPTAELESPPDPNAVPLGPVRISRAGLVVLAVLGVFALGAAWLARSRPGRALSAIRAWAAIVIASGFLGYFVLLALGDIATYTTWRETTCRIFDATVRVAQSTRRSGTRQQTQTYTPIFGLGYQADGVTVHSSGYASPTTASFGWFAPTQAALDRFAIGSDHPCWYDPDDPKTVQLVRGPGGAYFFALFPLPVLALGLFLLRRARR